MHVIARRAVLSGLAMSAIGIALTRARPLAAADLAPPKGPVILEVRGQIARTNADRVARFDMAMIEALPSARLSTSTPWTKGVQEFVGVPLRALLDAVGAQGHQVQATAINEYRSVIPLEDAVRDNALIAYRLNGQPMPVREKGPLWLVFPYDSSPRMRTDAMLGRSIWQLKTLQVD
jgi:hypothetical protein